MEVACSPSKNLKKKKKMGGMKMTKKKNMEKEWHETWVLQKMKKKINETVAFWMKLMNQAT